MSVTSLEDIDYEIIVQFDDKFFSGRLYIVKSDNYIAYCKFSHIELVYQLVDKSHISRYDLYDLFEDHKDITKHNFQIFSFNDYNTICEIILSDISDVLVRNYCYSKIMDFQEKDNIHSILNLLNQLILDSKSKRETLFQTCNSCSYHTTRRLFINKNQYNNKTFRFTIAKKILTLLKSSEVNRDIVKITIIHEPISIKYHIFDFTDTSDNSKYSITRSLINNSDGSYRVDLPREIFEILNDGSSIQNLFVRLDYDSSKIFFRLVNNNP